MKLRNRIRQHLVEWVLHKNYIAQTLSHQYLPFLVRHVQTVCRYLTCDLCCPQVLQNFLSPQDKKATMVKNMSNLGWELVDAEGLMVLGRRRNHRSPGRR